MLTPRHLLRCVHNVTGRRRLALAARARLHVAGVILEGIGAAVAVAAFTANSKAEREEEATASLGTVLATFFCCCWRFFVFLLVVLTSTWLAAACF